MTSEFLSDLLGAAAVSVTTAIFLCLPAILLA